MAVSVEQIADAMFELVKEYKGKKQYSARELTKTMIQKFGSECDRDLCKKAVRILVDSGKCVYTYKGGSYVEMPPDA
jgi:hypothetical protein